MASDNVAMLFPRGGTWYGTDGTIPASTNYGTSVKLEGQPFIFQDTNPVLSTTGFLRPITANTGNTKAVTPTQSGTLRSALTVKCICVRNVTGYTLQGGQVVAWQGVAVADASSNIGKRVGYLAEDYGASNVAGVVDDHLDGNGVRDGDLFWLIVSGPALCKTDFSNSPASYDAGNWAVACSSVAETGGSTATAGHICAITSLGVAGATVRGCAVVGRIMAGSSAAGSTTTVGATANQTSPAGSSAYQLLVKVMLA